MLFLQLNMQKKGASIVNCSWDSNEPDDKLKQVMTEYDDMLFICSAGKNGNDLSQKPVYPACFNLPNVVSVAAIDSNGKLIRDTGYGKSVDVAAPGENIFVSFPSNEFDYVQGTSYATAYVTGIAALVKSYKPDLNAIQIAEILKKSSDNGLEKLNISSEGFIDADKCLKNAKRAVKTNWKGESALSDFQVLLLNGLLILLVIAVQVVNLYLALRKKYNWAMILPIAATPFFLYNTYKAIYWVFHGRLLWNYSLIALYAFALIAIPIICRLIIRKRNKIA